MNTILTFLKNTFSNKNLLLTIFGIVIILLIFLNLRTCNNNKIDNQQAKQDSAAIKNVIVVEKNKAGLSQSSIDAYEGTISQLKNYNIELSKQVGDLKNRKPSVIIQTQTIYVHDTIKLLDSVVDEKGGKYALYWKYMSKDSSEIIEGNSDFNASSTFNKSNLTYKLNIQHATTIITKDQLKLNFVVGVAKNNKTGLDEIFITPQNSNIKVGELKGAILNKPKEKKYNVSFNLGYGVNYQNGTFGLGPYFGIGLSKSIFSF